MKLPAMPVRSGADATLDFEKVQKILTERELSVASARRGTARAIAAAGSTLIEPNTTVYDPGKNINASGAYVCPYDGVYYITCTAGVTNVAANATLIAEVTQDGTEVLRGTRILTPAFGIYNVTVEGLLRCKVGAQLAFLVFNGGVACELEITAFQNLIQVFKVA